MMDAAMVQPAPVRDEALGILARLGVAESCLRTEGACGPLADHGRTHRRMCRTPARRR